MTPVAFTGTLEQAAFLGSVTMNLPKCNLQGSGLFSWIVNVNKANKTFQVGAAKPPVDPHDGYSYVNELIDVGGQMLQIAPFTGPMLK